MKFIIEIKDKDFKTLKDFFISGDCEYTDDSKGDEQVINDLFIVDDDHDEILDIRDDVVIKKVEQ